MLSVARLSLDRRQTDKYGIWQVASVPRRPDSRCAGALICRSSLGKQVLDNHLLSRYDGAFRARCTSDFGS